MTSLPKLLAKAAKPLLSEAGIWRKPALSARGAAAWRKRLGEAFGEEELPTTAADETPSTSTSSPSTPTTTTTKPKPPPKPFGFRRFKGHKHDREAAAKRAKTELYISSGEADADIKAHKTAKREAGLGGASPIDRLLTQSSELRKRIGRSAPVTGKQGK